MTNDEARERAVLFRAMLTEIVNADKEELTTAINLAKLLLENYPFDLETLTILRKMVKD